MEKYLDKVSEAYFGKLGTPMAEKTRKRIHWIIKKTSGKKVLDIGCSQGITSLLLGREGKSVLGIDIAQEAIDYANESLAKEQEENQENVRFLKANFLYEDLRGEKFDTVIITEVLEHFVSSTEMLKKAHSLLSDSGELVVTVPFGINDFPDHKRTLYLAEIYQDLSPLFDVQDVEFLGKWIGFVARKTTQGKNEIIPVEIIERAEKSFYEIERDLLNKNDNLKNQNQKYKENLQEQRQKYNQLQVKLKQVENEKINLVTKLESVENNIEYHKKNQSEHIVHVKKLTEELKEKHTIIKGLQNNNNQLQEKLSILTVKFDYEKKGNELTKQENIVFKEKLEKELGKANNKIDESESLKEGIKSLTTENESLIKEKQILINQNQEANAEYKTQIENINQILLDNKNIENRAKFDNVKTKEDLMDSVATIEKVTEQLIIQKKKYEVLQQKYNSLKNSKLGKLTIKYWKLKNKVH